MISGIKLILGPVIALEKKKGMIDDVITLVT